MESTGKAAVAEFVTTFALIFIGAGAVVAQSLGLDLTGVALAQDIASGKGIVIEATTTFFLVFAVFGTAVDPRGPWSKTAGLTIGLVIAFDIMAFGPYTGAAMNPARWFGPALASGSWANWFVWIIGPIAGAIIAAVLYATVFLKDREPVTP